MDIGFEHILDIDGQAQPGQIDGEADGRDLGFYCMQKRLLYGPKNKLQLTLYMAGVGTPHIYAAVPGLGTPGTPRSPRTPRSRSTRPLGRTAGTGAGRSPPPPSPGSATTPSSRLAWPTFILIGINANCMIMTNITRIDNRRQSG